jgi:hypothetical protein
MIRLNRPNCPNQTALSGGNYKHPDNKEALKTNSHDKCMYCESKISHIDHAHIEHIKPKDQFPELEFDWNNLGYACPKCNNQKHNKYHEDTPFINPYDEDPQNHIAAGLAMLFPRQGSERGELTIKEIGLNRPELLEKRGERIIEVQQAINACNRTTNQTLRDDAEKSLQAFSENDSEYSMCARSMMAILGI